MYPSPSQVLAGVQYGPTGTEFVGTATFFADHFTVTTTEQTLFVMPVQADKQTSSISESPAKKTPQVKRLFVFTEPESLTVATAPDTLNVIEVRK